ncbi:hypothetical protein ACEPAH_6373 [Sanghuangporus vaninii]
MEDVLKVVEGWDPLCEAILTKAPSCVDWKLVYRILGQASKEPPKQSRTGSPSRSCFTWPVKKGVPLTVRAWEKIRYGRVHRAQLIGESWSKSRPEAKGKAVELPHPKWLLDFHAEKHACDVYEQTAKEIKERGYRFPVLPPREPVEEEEAEN